MGKFRSWLESLNNNSIEDFCYSILPVLFECNPADFYQLIDYVQDNFSKDDIGYNLILDGLREPGECCSQILGNDLVILGSSTPHGFQLATYALAVDLRKRRFHTLFLDTIFNDSFNLFNSEDTNNALFSGFDVNPPTSTTFLIQVCKNWDEISEHSKLISINFKNLPVPLYTVILLGAYTFNKYMRV